MTAVLVALADLNASGWIEHRKRDVGPYADYIIRCVRAYEIEIQDLRELVKQQSKFIDAAFEVYPNLDLDVERVIGAKEDK
jgi:hypothetical protein